MESELEQYLVKCSSMFYSLTPKLERRLACEYAIKNTIEVNKHWLKDQSATEDWFCGFMHRHRRLSIRKPEATSVARITSFNRITVKLFQDKLEQVLFRHSFTPEQTLDLHET